VDVVIHCAHSFQSASLNVQGTERLYAAAQRHGVSFIVFISSMAAFDGCKSEYGSTKLGIEALTTRARGLSIRPGTIWGGDSGGLMRSLENLVRKLPMVPLIGSGAQRLYLVHIEDLVALVCSAIEHRERLRGHVLSVAHSSPLTLRELLGRIAARFGLQRLMIPIPTLAILGGLRLGELLGLRLPVRIDSVRSLTNANPSPDLTLPDVLRSVTLRAYD
jgi:NADH dehydrogenase